jgi:TPR repeat protein
MLFRKLADENADADPDEGHRAPFVAKALTALAGYLRTGVPELKVAPDLDRAIECLQNAATSFGDQDAQFELAKIYLSRGEDDDIKLGKHFLPCWPATASSMRRPSWPICIGAVAM